MKTKYIRWTILSCSIVLLIAYFILASMPEFDTEKNVIYLRALYIIPFVLLIIHALLKHNRE